jgi:hypothetical protein
MDNDAHIGPFNIGNPGEFTMLELAQLVREVVNPDVEVCACVWGGKALGYHAQRNQPPCNDPPFLPPSPADCLCRQHL